MKLKHIAAASLAIAAAAPSFAAVSVGPLDSAEMFLVVGDENGSFLFDTGLKVSDFLSGVQGAGYLQQWSISGAAWDSYKAADTNLLDGTVTKGTRWALVASAGTGLPSPEHNLVTTVNVGQNVFQDMSNADFDANDGIGIANVVTNANQTGTHKGSFALNGQSHNKKGENNTHFLGGFTLETSNFFIGNKVGVDAGMARLAGSSEEGFESILATDLSAAYGVNVSFDGNTLTVATPAVPEPESYALMLAGLIGMGLMVRRRRAD